MGLGIGLAVTSTQQLLQNTDIAAHNYVSHQFQKIWCSTLTAWVPVHM